MKLRYILPILALCASPAFAQMDEIEKQNDEIVKGDILDMSYKTIQFNQDVDGSKIRVPIDAWDVRSIKLGSRKNNPPDLSTGIRKFENGKYSDAIRSLDSVIKNTRNSSTARQYAYWYLVQAKFDSRDYNGAASAIRNFRTSFGQTYFLFQTFEMEYDISRAKGDSRGMQKSVDSLKAKANELGIAAWKKSAQVKEAELYEFSKKYAQAKRIYSGLSRDKQIGNNARLGEMRCMAALKEWGPLEQKGKAILGEARSAAKSKKPFDLRLVMGAYTGIGDAEFSRGSTKDALLSYMRVVVDVGPRHPRTCREHEAAIAKAAIAAAKYASESADGEVKATYKGRAQSLLTELTRSYGSGSGWVKPIQQAIASVK